MDIYSISSKSSTNSSLSNSSNSDNDFENLSTISASSEEDICSIKEEMESYKERILTLENKVEQNNIILEKFNAKIDKILNSQLFNEENNDVIHKLAPFPQLQKLAFPQLQKVVLLPQLHKLAPAPELSDYNKKTKFCVKQSQLTLNNQNYLSPVHQFNDFNSKIIFPVSALVQPSSVNLVLKSLCNKWSKILVDWGCCKNNCQNISQRGFCQKGNGIVRLRDNFAKYYLSTIKNGINRKIKIIAEKGFNSIKDNYCFYYFEVKITPEIEEKCGWSAEVGLYLNNAKQYHICSNGIYCSKTLLNSPYKQYLMFDHSIKPNDIIGCGIYFSDNKLIFPQLFFTINGEKLEKTIFLDNSENVSEYFPCVSLFCCSVEANFGTNKFLYKIEEFKPKEFIF